MHQMLEQFGKSLIKELRNGVVKECHAVIDGKMFDTNSHKIRDSLSHFSEEELEIIKHFSTHCCDKFLHSMLLFIEEQDNISLLIRSPNETLHDVASMSDGLPGELYSDEGWLRKYGD